MTDEIERHLLGSPDHERVGKVDDPDTSGTGHQTRAR